MWSVKEFKNNEVNKKLLKEFSGRRILFLENDFTMHNSIGNFWLWCKENKIEYNCLYNVRKLPIEYTLEQVDWFNVIAFQSQWVYEESFKLKEAIAGMKDKKTVVECYISEPTWYYKPKNVVHDVFVLDSHDDDMDEWKLNKLRLNKAIWDK